MQLARSLAAAQRPPIWLAAAFLVSILLAVQTIAALVTIPVVREGATDFETFRAAGDLIAAGRSPFLEPPQYRWSPLAAYFFTLPLTLPVWWALHFAAVALLRDWKLIALVATSWPFWFEIDVGNAVTFTAVAGYFALRGSRAGELAWFALALLVPRPLVIPLTVWLLWKRPHTRLPALVLLIASIAGAALTGYGGEWVARLLESGGDVANFWNLAPSRFIGYLWWPAAFALGAWFTLRGRLGLASLAISPYILPYYGLMLLLEAVPRRPRHPLRVERIDGGLG